MAANNLFGEEERHIQNFLRDISKVLGRSKDYRDFHILVLSALEHAAERRFEQSAKDFGEIEASFPDLWKIYVILNAVYTEAFHQGLNHHEKGHSIGTFWWERDPNFRGRNEA